mmetsp:Transcript_9529/g.10244  ORF Transcript_9529/g.10244 Transcript_9529/m.10244 type:complete len:117 (+) Transcript_9529:76-426(+)|eukprot:gene9489-10304_t
MEKISNIVPDEFKALRACLRCGLIKTFIQFNERGCDNCEFLDMEGNRERVNECTTSTFEGMIAMIDPGASWVAKWQRIVNYKPGMYCIELAGQLPDDALEYCEEYGLEYKANRTDK